MYITDPENYMCKSKPGMLLELLLGGILILLTLPFVFFAILGSFSQIFCSKVSKWEIKASKWLRNHIG